MNDSIIFGLISDGLLTSSVCALARTSRSLYSAFSEVTKSNYWWFARTRILLSPNLEGERSDSWKNVYQTLYPALRELYCGSWDALSPSCSLVVAPLLSCSLCTRLLLTHAQLIDPALNSMLVLACSLGKTTALPLLLSDRRIDPTWMGNAALKIARERGHSEVVELLLRDKRVAGSLL